MYPPPQAARFGAVFHQDLVVSVDTKTRPFTIVTNETEIKTHSIVVATGADSRWLGVPGEWEMRGQAVSPLYIYYRGKRDLL